MRSTHHGTSRNVRLCGRSLAIFTLISAGAFAQACTSGPKDLSGLSTFKVNIVSVNGNPPPTFESPIPPNLGDVDDAWQFDLTALDAFGEPVDYNGYARVQVEPGAVNAVENEGGTGRNVLFVNGKATGTAYVTAVYGPSRLWVEDVGYVPVDPSTPPRCADGIDNDEDGFIDYPADGGCAFADDDTEEPGTFAAGVSSEIHYDLPRIADLQGAGTETPYPFEGILVRTADPQFVVVTRVASDGFYATDLNGPEGASNSIFAFNFNTPPGMRVCDRLVYFSGTLVEFFGFTELSFPSYDVTFPKEGEGECQVPEPTILDSTIINDPVKMETLESSLVRIEGYHIAKNFGPKPVENNLPKPDASNCDLNGDGQIDFENPKEASCANVCSDDPECSEWTGFSARGNYKVSKGSSQIQVQTSAIADFDPPSFKGQELVAVTGTMRNFSGGSLNWTIEARCPDDLVCTFTDSCSEQVLTSKEACVRLRTTNDPDEASN
ncbi:MAG: hypothetical protein IPK82_02800 [Polyangiaceae bacterium]|nr:hypothetical protein [Polyangiaceae bacterium]